MCNISVVTRCCTGRSLRRSSASNGILQELLLDGEACNQPLTAHRTNVVTDLLNNKEKDDSTLATSISLPRIDMNDMSSSVTFFKGKSWRNLVSQLL